MKKVNLNDSLTKNKKDRLISRYLFHWSCTREDEEGWSQEIYLTSMEGYREKYLKNCRSYCTISFFYNIFKSTSIKFKNNKIIKISVAYVSLCLKESSLMYML